MIVRIIKYLLTVFVAVFMVLIYMSGITPSTPLATVADSMVEIPSVQELAMENSQQIVRYLSLYPEDYKELHYWKSTDGMNASEVVIAEAVDSEQMAKLKAAILQRVSDQRTAFNGYAPEQEAKLDSYVLKTRGNYLFYAVGSPEELRDWEAVFDGIQ